MAGIKPGPAPRRHLSAVKEGNPSHRPTKDTPKLPPAKPLEPNWVEIFPTTRADLVGLKGETRTRETKDTQRRNGEALRCRSVARKAWRIWAVVLYVQGFISEVDPQTLEDAACCWAEIDKARRDISRRGDWVFDPRIGVKKNPSVTALAQRRTAFKIYSAALGLAPGYRVGMVASFDPGGGGAEEDDPFD